MEGCEGISENLHRLINNEEYENKKLVRLIDYEKDKQTALQDQLDQLKQQIKETEIQNELIDREMSDLNRQFTANTSLVGTLKVANKMSQQHVNDTYKKLDRLIEDGEKRVLQYESALEKKSEIWVGYEKKYCTIPGVPQLMLLEEEVENLEKKAQIILKEINQKHSYCDPKLIDAVVEIAEKAIENRNKKLELEEKEEIIITMRGKKDKLVEEQNCLMDEKAAAKMEQQIMDEQLEQQQKILSRQNLGGNTVDNTEMNYIEEEEQMQTENPIEELSSEDNVIIVGKQLEISKIHCPPPKLDPPTPKQPFNFPKMSTPKLFSIQRPTNPSFVTPSIISPIIKTTPKLNTFVSPKPGTLKPIPVMTNLPKPIKPISRPLPSPKIAMPTTPKLQLKHPTPSKLPVKQSTPRPTPQQIKLPSPKHKPLVPYSPRTPIISKPTPTTPKLPTKLSTPKTPMTPKLKDFNKASFKTPKQVFHTPMTKTPKRKEEEKETEMDTSDVDWKTPSTSFHFNQQSPQLRPSVDNDESAAMFGSPNSQDQGNFNFGFMESTDSSGGFGMFAEGASPQRVQQEDEAGFAFNFGGGSEGGDSNCNSLFG